ncbi:YcxB family protein [Streptomyces zingiberis]|uniref:YcxB family protein n=1 Tax=Streptomyces zingiberis TaxID=2053010 RepID=A0ABX1C6R9_9ACTN|nr:YcxB family protein [Streptomyces zingiberis]NJQ03627.1 YcxB family protein [Streptomyces zingiberis]
MPEKAHVRESVTLVYQPTAEDITEALRARARLARTRNAVRAGVVFLLIFVFLTGLAHLSGDPDPVLSSATGTAVAAVAGGVALLLGHRMQGRMVRRLVEAQGRCRTTVDDTGMRTAGERGESTATWENYPRYLETENLFVALSRDRRSTGVGALPKRGLKKAADADRLREIFDRNARRAGPPAAAEGAVRGG